MGRPATGDLYNTDMVLHYPIFTTLSHNIALHQIVTMFQNSEWHYI